MTLRIVKGFASSTLLILLLALPALSQVRVDMSKSLRRFPHECKAIQPASLEPQIDIPALIKEASCKGAGEVLIEYSYTMDSSSRTLDKNGKSKTSTTTYEVFLPTLKSGTRARGILIETAKDGVPVPADKLESARKKAGERLEKEEERIEREAPVTPQAPATNEDTAPKGMAPIGTYSRMSIDRSVMGVNHVRLAFTILTFLQACNFTLLRQETIAGRPTLIFKFNPRPNVKFNEGEEYIAQLSGEMAIDAQDHIVTRLIGWPSGSDSSSPPAVYQEMTRLADGIWLPSLKRVNGADYPKLFNGLTWDWSALQRNYVRFVTEIKAVKVGESPN